jgi:5-methylcytosine-specific restriction endonuclease McrA
MYDEQLGLCYWCKAPLQLMRPRDDDYATLDELLPRSRGGTQRRENVVVSCRPCNQDRADTIAPQKPTYPNASSAS